MNARYPSGSFKETPPKAGAMINTFRAFGYNLQTAIADIVDNSISACAGNVWITYRWAGKDSWVTITDDGKGMDEESLVEAMTPGSKDPALEREEHDLGRFGLGLKTSSFSQCKCLTVISKMDDGPVFYRCWDLDFVNETGKWNLLEYLSNEQLSKELEALGSGTTVVWEKTDRLVGEVSSENESARKVFLEEFEKVEEHLGMVFHRYLEKKKLVIWMNDRQIDSWDPFMKETDGIQRVASERLEDEKVEVKCYVLPHISMLNPEQRKKYKVEQWYTLQGFYIYRNSRLLLAGSWLGLFPKNEHFKNARILVDIPNKLDHDWKIDIKKATATPAVSVRDDLVRLAKMTRKRSGEVHRFRGNKILLDDSIESFSFESIWKARVARDNARYYYINEEHPLIKSLLENKHITATDFKRVLKLIGDTTPVEAIIQFNSEDPESHELRNCFGEPEPGMINLAKRMYSSLIESGENRKVAIKRILNIEPFNNFPQLVEYFE